MMAALLTFKLKRSFSDEMNGIFEKYKMGSLDKLILSLIDFNKMKQAIEKNLREVGELKGFSDELYDYLSELENITTGIVTKLISDMEDLGMDYTNSEIFRKIKVDIVKDDQSTTQH
jgi:hypothetical protein